MARIPINSCPGCTHNWPIDIHGYHRWPAKPFEKRRRFRCPFVVEEEVSLGIRVMEVCFSSKQAGLRARRLLTTVLWTGQMPISNKWPHGFFLVVDSLYGI